MSTTKITSENAAEAIKQNGKKVVDVSRWNEITDAKAAKQDGVEGAIVKACSKDGKSDPKFNEHINKFNAAGIPIIAAYDYTYANTVKSAANRAKTFVELCASKGIKRCELDLEDSCMAGLGHGIVDIINVYRSEVESAGMTFGIYTGASFFNPCLKNYMNELSDIPFWWSRYPSSAVTKVKDPCPDLKYLPKGINLDGWQYTFNAKVSGFKGNVDLSIWWAGETIKNPTNVDDLIRVDVNPFTEPTVTVSYGMKGEAVKWVQWVVWRCGCFLNNGVPMILEGKAEIDGIFGNKTMAGVKEVQRRLNMPITGKVKTADRAVWNKLF